MELSPHLRPPKFAIFVFIYEALGTLLLHVGAGLTTVPDLVYMAPISVFIAIFLTDWVSGAHFNLAVTLGVFLHERRHWK